MPVQTVTIEIDANMASRVIQRELDRLLGGQNIEGQLLTSLNPPALGEYWLGEGGHNAGLVRGENGQPDYYLIVPAGLAAECKAEWGGHGTETEGATSPSDGLANTQALLADSADHPAAKLASQYTADGHADFYLPARRELQLAEANVPELFSKAWYWSSTQYSAYGAFRMDFEGGWQDSTGKYGERLVRPVRRRLL